VLTIWRGSAARYQLTHPGASAEAFADPLDTVSQAIVDIVDVLADLVDASMPVAS
jgi:hypothetical protein